MKLPAKALLPLILLSSCAEIRTEDPIEAFKYWAGAVPTSEVIVLKGQYWQSAHWTKEYILYLQVRPTSEWWNEFVNQNRLQIADESWFRPTDAPIWFQPGERVEVFKSRSLVDGARYFRNKDTGDCYIYEIQL